VTCYCFTCCYLLLLPVATTCGYLLLPVTCYCLWLPVATCDLLLLYLLLPVATTCCYYLWPPGSHPLQWSLGLLRKRLSALGVDFPSLWTRIVALIVKSLVAVAGRIEGCRNAFEVFGYDVECLGWGRRGSGRA
jgi:hypothetical protein